MDLLIGSIAALALSGGVGLLSGRGNNLGQLCSAAISVGGGIGGLTTVANWFGSGNGGDWQRAWHLVPGADFHVALDGISAVFLLPIFMISVLGPIYGLGYWRQSENPTTGRKLGLFYGLCVAGMALLVVARNSVVFLFGWEVMALSAFLLVATEDDKLAVRESAWIYLVATHTATLLLFGLFGLLRASSGSFDWPRRLELSTIEANVVFVLALVGFGFKAGIMPLHVWLPGAHANAPSHVSALMSGVLIKMGVYGFVRVMSFLPQPPVWWGGLLLALGVLSGVLALAMGVAQQDFKRLLAYSSVENIGIIFIGLGMALLGRSVGHAEWVALGLGGALWHVWNHSLFKSLLFFSAGSVIHGAGTREINQLGGLAKRMPATATCFLIAAIAVCGLPPLNGFVSELSIYIGLFSTLGIGLPGAEAPTIIGASLAAPGLALIGAMAVACYATTFGGMFLGSARSEHSAQAHESGWCMLGPMFLLAAGCLAIGLLPGLATPLLNRAIADWTSAGSLSGALMPPPLESLAPLRWVGVLGFALIGLCLIGGVALWTRLQGGMSSTSVTWDCGYLAPTPRMQYTSSSFSELLVTLFRWVVRPKVTSPSIRELFPQAAAYRSEVPDSVLERLVLPALRWFGGRVLFFRVFQQGSLQAYLFYILVILMLLLIWPH